MNLLIPQIASAKSVMPVPWGLINGGLQVDRTKSKHNARGPNGRCKRFKQARRCLAMDWLYATVQIARTTNMAATGKIVVSCLSMISRHDLDL